MDLNILKVESQFRQKVLDAAKRIYGREELVAACRPGQYMCAFCRCVQTYVEEFLHAKDCPFTDAAVVAVEVVTLTAANAAICGGCRLPICDAPLRMAKRTNEALFRTCSQYAHCSRNPI